MQEYKLKKTQIGTYATGVESPQQRRMRLRRETIAALTGTGVTILGIDISSTSQRCG